MIIVKIFQGLGNQLFQYAFGRSLSICKGYELKVDNSYYLHYSEIVHHGYTVKRNYGLNRFNILQNIAASDEEVRKLHTVSGNNRISRLFNIEIDKRASYYLKKVVKEQDTVFDSNLLLIKDNTYIEGYFASEKYFKNHRNLILKEFTLKTQVTKKNQEIINRMHDSQSVCISIRRTDFLTNPLHNVCTDQYYKNALSTMSELVRDMHVFIFSDDNDYVVNNFKLPFKHEFITHNYPDFYEDFRLMTNCKHHIVPNSTFSWWAAWLSDFEEKKVIAPRVWLNSTTIDFSTVIPEEWIKIENIF